MSSRRARVGRRADPAWARRRTSRRHRAGQAAVACVRSRDTAPATTSNDRQKAGNRGSRNRQARESLAAPYSSLYIIYIMRILGWACRHRNSGGQPTHSTGPILGWQFVGASWLPLLTRSVLGQHVSSCVGVARRVVSLGLCCAHLGRVHSSYGHCRGSAGFGKVHFGAGTSLEFVIADLHQFFS